MRLNMQICSSLYPLRTQQINRAAQRVKEMSGARHWQSVAALARRVAVRIVALQYSLHDGVAGSAIARFQSFFANGVPGNHPCLEELGCDQQHVGQSCQVWDPYGNSEC
jgi:hypothetical protein